MRYRPRKVDEVEAVMYTGDNFVALRHLVGEDHQTFMYWDTGYAAYLRTSDNTREVHKGDYVIKFRSGRFEVMDQKTFNMEYQSSGDN